MSAARGFARCTRLAVAKRHAGKTPTQWQPRVPVAGIIITRLLTRRVAGSYPLFIKTAPVLAAKPHPVVFQLCAPLPLVPRLIPVRHSRSRRDPPRVPEAEAAAARHGAAPSQCDNRRSLSCRGAIGCRGRYKSSIVFLTGWLFLIPRALRTLPEGEPLYEFSCAPPTKTVRADLMSQGPRKARGHEAGGGRRSELTEHDDHRDIIRVL